MKTHVDKEACIGCGLCTDNVPQVYQMNEDGIAEEIARDVPAEHEKAASDAAADCPVNAIEIVK